MCLRQFRKETLNRLPRLSACRLIIYFDMLTRFEMASLTVTSVNDINEKNYDKYTTSLYFSLFRSMGNKSLSYFAL